MWHYFSNGLTVKELKELVKDLPEIDGNGDDYEVWMETGRGLSSQVKSVISLNVGDILFESGNE